MRHRKHQGIPRAVASRRGIAGAEFALMAAALALVALVAGGEMAAKVSDGLNSLLARVQVDSPGSSFAVRSGNTQLAALEDDAEPAARMRSSRQ